MESGGTEGRDREEGELGKHCAAGRAQLPTHVASHSRTGGSSVIVTASPRPMTVISRSVSGTPSAVSVAIAAVEPNRSGVKPKVKSIVACGEKFAAMGVIVKGRLCPSPSALSRRHAKSSARGVGLRSVSVRETVAEGQPSVALPSMSVGTSSEKHCVPSIASEMSSASQPGPTTS